ncbi:hypothetical protein GCM10023085_55930 [Actinomadura viridis]|uniref:Sortase (Surface protein transpeptidase) n=1 Tax=Actinomadura viridis TaxID=58110 RepID=A0A931DWF6_9ACTN|nr:class F sortase [Actinomadura viridis]MBG6093998.1 sortase (surface protein transpeptidase) [Actinomadura viridis]
MGHEKRGGRSAYLWYGVAAALIAIGAALGIAGLRLDRSTTPPQPSVSELAESGPAARSADPRGVRALPASVPRRVLIPEIKVSAPVVPLGLQENGEIAVPPLSRVHEAGWYRNGPTPGEKGPAVIVGHVDSRKGPGVFFKLGALRPGGRIQIVRGDGVTATFRVQRVQRVDKDSFPTKRVYGRVDEPALRLITCGGTFDRARGHYTDNIIVYAAPLADAWPSASASPPRRERAQGAAA